jgi:crotonobetainyl-CoA:carnitine CoA-transferase CaiB-like acyl-CoA transferase
MNDNYASALGNIKVLDLTEGRGLYTGKLLADFGADVVKIEKPTGSDSRRVGPFKDDTPGLETSLYFINFNLNKKGITLELESPMGHEIFKRLAAGADVIVEDFAPGKMKSLGLDYSVLREINKRLILASITGFGQDGPYSGFKAPDIVSVAMSGMMNVSGAVNEPPVTAPCEQAYQSTSILTAFSILSALFLRLKSGEGQLIDASAHEALSAFTIGIMNYSATGGISARSGSQFGAAPARIYPCKDGFVHILVIRPNHWKIFVELLGNPSILAHEAWYDSIYRTKNRKIIDELVTLFTMKHTKTEIVQLCQSRGIPCTAVNTPEEFSHNPHETARKFIGTIEHPAIGLHSYLSHPYSLSETPCKIQRPAPLLGQHNLEIYSRELGYSQEELTKFKAEGII